MAKSTNPDTVLLSGKISRGKYTLVTRLAEATMLSLAPLAAVLYALRQGAPSNLTLAGAIGGLLSAGVGATLYASHCADDSPLFVATWYPFANRL